MHEPRRRLYLFTYAGGGSSAYARLLLHLRPHCDAVTVDVFGARDHVASESAIACGRETVERGGVSEPYIVFGHSLGGLVAAATVSALARAGAVGALQKLVLSACLPPHLRADVVERLPGLPSVCGPERPVGPIGSWARAAAELNERAVAQVMAFHDLEPRLARVGSLSMEVYEADADPLVRPGEMAGWRAYTRGRFTARRFPGSHFYFRTQARQVCAALLAPPTTQESRPC